MAMPESLLAQLDRAWKELEPKVRLGISRREAIAEFLRGWTMRAAEASSEERQLMLSMLDSARETLNAQALEYEELIRDGKRKAEEKSRLESEQKVRSDAARADRAEYDRRQREQIQREAAAKLEKTREETRAIQRETEKIQQEGRERQRLMNRILTNPELYCPHCNRAYADKTGGCPHCTAHFRPW